MAVVISSPCVTLDNLWPPDGLPEGKRATIRFKVHEEGRSAPVGDLEVKTKDALVYEDIRKAFPNGFTPRAVSLKVTARLFSGDKGNVLSLNVEGVQIGEFQPAKPPGK